jgi:subtilase family protein
MPSTLRLANFRISEKAPLAFHPTAKTMKIRNNNLTLWHLAGTLAILSSWIPLSLWWPFTSSAASIAAGTKIVAGKLRKGDRVRLATARVNGEKDALLVIASVTGANGVIEQEVKQVGGKVRYRDDDVSYISVRVPIHYVECLAKPPFIEALNIDDGTFQYYADPTLAPDEEHTPLSIGNSSREGESRALEPNLGSYLNTPLPPATQFGASGFIVNHPTFDGRGVTVATIDGLPDLLHPTLATAKSLDGKPIHKVVDVLETIDPTVNPFMVRMADRVIARDQQFNYNGFAYVAPADGSYMIGLSGREGYTVLWDKMANTIWVDTNKNMKFTDEKRLTDYSEHFDIGNLSNDHALTVDRKAQGFVVKTYLIRNEYYVGIHFIGSKHSTMITSAIAGKGFFGKKINGVAPEAQIIAINPGNWQHAVIEALILAAKHPKVDVITLQHTLETPFNDGGCAAGVIADRLIQRYKKPVFVSAGNSGPGLNTLNEYASSNEVISVGSYIYRDTLRSIYGVRASMNGYIATLSSRGPTEDGGFKPDLLVPVGGVYASPLSDDDTHLVPIGYKVPHGYRVSTFGTSFAAPVAAGFAALLISSAKQRGVPCDIERIRNALKSTAHFLPSYSAYEQGSGLVNIAAAWEALKSLPQPATIFSSAYTNTAQARHLKQAYHGRGIYEREGWGPRTTRQRYITFTRISGLQVPVTYRVKWTGDNDCFSSPQAVTLPLNTPVTLPILISTKKVGIHSAILTLADARSSSVAYQVMNTVIAAEKFSPNNDYTITHKESVEYLDSKSYFFYVPPDTSVIDIGLTVTSGTGRLLAVSPSGREDIYHLYFSGIDSARAEYIAGGMVSRTIPTPQPGVWEFIVETQNITNNARRLSFQPKVSFVLKASIFGAQVSSIGGVVNLDHIATGYPLNINVMNRYSSFTGHISDSYLGSAFDALLTKNLNSAPDIFEINILPNTQIISAAITNTPDKEADYDLYLFDCTGNKCRLAGVSTGDSLYESVTVMNPAAGKWKTLIDPVFVPSDGINILYRDIFTNEAFGTVESYDKPSTRIAGGSWDTEIRINPLTQPTGDRCLVGFIQVQSRDICVKLRPLIPTASSLATHSYTQASLGDALIEVKFRQRISLALPEILPILRWRGREGNFILDQSDNLSSYKLNQR